MAYYNGYGGEQYSRAPHAAPPPSYAAVTGYSPSPGCAPGFIQGTATTHRPPYPPPASQGWGPPRPYAPRPPLGAGPYSQGKGTYGKGAYGKGGPPFGVPAAAAPNMYDGWREGDWACPACHAMNFARREECFQCGVPAQPGHSLGPGAGYGPPAKRPRLQEGEYPPTHPCLRVFSFCKGGPACPFMDFPSNACLLFLKGKCRFGDRCLEPHYRQEADGTFVASPAFNPDMAPPPPDGCHPCVRVYGSCRLGNACHFASLPAEACLMHLKGRCRFGTGCKERHLTPQELAEYFPGGHLPGQSPY